MFVAGFSTTLNSAVTKSIIKTMEMNGSLESSPAGLKAKEGREREEEEEDEDEEETTRKGMTIQRLREDLIMSPAFDLLWAFGRSMFSAKEEGANQEAQGAPAKRKSDQRRLPPEQRESFQVNSEWRGLPGRRASVQRSPRR